MAQNLHPGQQVFVPTRLLPNPDSYGTALVVRTVAGTQGRSATLSLDDGAISGPIATSKLHVDLRVLVLRVGDFDTESTLLDPLAKSIMHFLRLFMDDGFVHLLQVRSLNELAVWWPTNIGAYSHLVLIAHGDVPASSITFGVGGNKTASEIGEALAQPNPRQLHVLSVACQSGLQCFAQPFSVLPFCSTFIAPFHSIPGAIGSQFCQSFFANHLLLGDSVTVAWRHARAATPGLLSFRLWRNGTMQPVGS